MRHNEPITLIIFMIECIYVVLNYLKGDSNKIEQIWARGEGAFSASSSHPSKKAHNFPRSRRGGCSRVGDMVDDFRILYGRGSPSES